MSPKLYPEEVLDTISGFPTLYHFQPAASTDSSTPNPLVVCIPGGCHLGRIFYGPHEGARPEDFLAHWLSQAGFPVLSHSYPVETNPPIMPPSAATYKVQDWGKQAAETTAKVLDEQKLSNRSVYLLSWSMGGRMVVPFTITAKRLGINVLQYVSLAATPGFTSLRVLHPDVKCSETGYYVVPGRMNDFCDQLSIMTRPTYGEREIIPRDTYRREYIGGNPVSLVGIGMKYDGKGAFVRDEIPHEVDTSVMDIANFPLVSALYPNWIQDFSHALTDKASWGFILTYKIEKMLNAKSLAKLQKDGTWEKFIALVQAAPDRLLRQTDGNHFFFLGEVNAKRTADRVTALFEEGQAYLKEVNELLA